MKYTIYTTLLVLIASCTITNIEAQTLNPGDIAIIEYQSDAAPTQFTFVCLIDIPGNEKIYFTDNEFDGTAMTSGEGILEWTTPAAGVPCGTTVTFNNNFSIGSFSTGLGSFGLQAGNAQDEVIIYQNATNFIFAAPTTFIYALSYSNAAWTPGVNDIPTGLTDGVTAHAVGHIDNGAYIGSTIGSQAALLSLISNTANWNTSNALGPVYTGPNPMTVTSCLAGCSHSVTAYAPASGPEGTIVTITGNGFTASSTVDFNGTTASTVIFVNSTTLVAIVPAAATTGNITVTESGCAEAGPSFTVIDQSGTCGTPPVINTEPTDVNTCPFSMTIAATDGAGGTLSYQWRFNDGISVGWTDVNTTNLPGITVAGETTDNLTLGADLSSINGYQFYCEVTEGTCIVASNAAQLNFDNRFFRSRANGGWNNVTRWESAPAAIGPWTMACACPNATNSDYIHISTGNNINVNRDIIADQLVVESGASLNINTNRLLTIRNDIGVDLDIIGTLIDNGTAGNGLDLSTNSATWRLGVNGEIIKTRNSSVNEYRDNYETGISNIPETAAWRYRYTGAGVVTISTVAMFYPTLFFESSDPLGHDFSGATEVFTGNSSFATVKGNFFIGTTEVGHVIVHNTNSNASPMLVLGNTTIGGNSSLNRSSFANNLGANIGTGLDIRGDLIINSNGGLDFDDGLASTPDGTLSLSGNWNNLATETDFEQGESTVSFEGSNTQTLSISSGFERFYILRVNKLADALNPLSDIHVENTVIFSNGIINNNFGANFLFETNAVANNASNASHIDGPIQKETTVSFTQNFTFPTGDNGRLGQIGIETRPGVLDNDIFTAEYFALASPNPTQLLAPIDHVSFIEYWTLDEADGNGDSDAKVTLHWGAHSDVVVVTDLRVGHYKASNLWEMEGDIPNIIHTGTIASGTITSDWVTTYSPFTLADINFNGGSLPLDLLAFDAIKVDNSAKIYWSVANEMLGDFYELEYSTDASSFETIFSKMATQNQSTAHYDYLHNFPTLGDNYYRLKQTDAAGLVSYGPTKTLNFDRLSTVLSLFPNPAQNSITVVVPGTLSEDIHIEVVDVLGRVVFKTFVAKEIRSLTLDTQDFAEGYYFLRWGNENRTYVTHKFAIQR